MQALQWLCNSPYIKDQRQILVHINGWFLENTVLKLISFQCWWDIMKILISNGTCESSWGSSSPSCWGQAQVSGCPFENCFFPLCIFPDTSLFEHLKVQKAISQYSVALLLIYCPTLSLLNSDTTAKYQNVFVSVYAYIYVILFRERLCDFKRGLSHRGFLGHIS